MPRKNPVIKVCENCGEKYEVMQSTRKVCYSCKPKQKPRTKNPYTEEQCIQIAKKYDGWQDLIKNNKTAYYRIQHLNLYNEIATYYRQKHNEVFNKKVENRKQKAIETALEYTSFKEFQLKEASLYRWLLFHHIDICEYTGWVKKTQPVTLDRINKALKKCKSKYDFQKKYNTEYNYLRKNGLWEEASKIYPEINSIGFDSHRFEGLFSNIVFYIIECYDEYEKFYKFGITSKSVEERFERSDRLPYDYNIIVEVCSETDFILKLENDFKKLTSKNRYKPDYPFFGSVLECFIETSDLNVDTILREMFP